MATQAQAKSAGSPSDGQSRSFVPSHLSRSRERGAETSRWRVTATNASTKPPGSLTAWETQIVYFVPLRVGRFTCSCRPQRQNYGNLGKARLRPLLRLSRSARKHGSDALGIDVEGQEGEGFIARTAPLVHEIERLVDQ